MWLRRLKIGGSISLMALAVGSRFNSLAKKSTLKKKKKKKKMASSSNARHGGNCFFKTITTFNILKNQLRIPKMIGNQLQVHDCVTLEVPTGDKWEVQLERDSRGVVSFCNHGWRRFTEFYSIDSGNFLHFLYQGCSDFLVFIYEKAPAEIGYPLRNDGQDSSVETEPADSLAMVVCHVPLNTMDEEEEGMDSNDDDEMPFNSEHPFFQIKISKSYLHIPQARIPATFTNEHSFIKDLKRVKFDMGDKVWSVNVKVYRYVKFGEGWTKFVKENSVKLGDVCFFELISTSPEVRFKVTISRNA
ncbi:B3 domain-containing protein At1g49475 [Linum perenne]